MDEQRTQAYLNLVNQLLSCNQGEEPQILQKNGELLDQALAEVMVSVAQQYGETGRENEAQRLLTIAQQLTEALGLLRYETTETAYTPQDHFNFLMEVLQKVDEDPSPQVIYPFLTQNLDKLDDDLKKVLENWSKNTLFFVEIENKILTASLINDFSLLLQKFPSGNIAINQEIAIIGYQITLSIFTFEGLPTLWAMTQNNLAIAYLYRIRGNKADNLEMALSIYQNILTVFTFDTFPVEWAATQNNLGITFRKRIKENRAENLENAINHYHEALKVRTLENFPVDWAMTLNNLANVYRERIRGNKADNIEQAITYFQKALKVRTFDNFPEDWATTQNNLALAYLDRIKGDRAENLEQAITYFQEALKVRIFDDFPEDWAVIQNNLANTYSDRIRGDKADNIEQAILHFQEALKVRSFDDFPEDWAATQNNLGEIYRNRIRGTRVENLEIAVEAYQNALKIYTFDDFPTDWASTQNNLAIAYLDRIRGDRAENLEIAIAYFREALKIRTFDDFPEDWASTQNNLAIAYCDRIQGDRVENLEKAIDLYQKALMVRKFNILPIKWAETQNNIATAYSNLGIINSDRIQRDRSQNLERAINAFQKSLSVYTFEALPYEWAMTQNNLAVAYSDRIKGNKIKNLQKAIASYHNALKIRTKENDPLNCLQTARSLANLYYKQKKWQPATETYHIAIEAVENTRLEALNPQSRQEVLSNAIDVFHSIIQVHLNLNQPEKALEYIERSKTRNLVELMTQKNLKPRGVSQTIIEEYEHLYQQVVNEQIRLQHQSINQNLSRNDNLTPYITDHSYLQEYKQALDTFIEQEIIPIDPTFKLTQKVEPISFKDIQFLTDAETCLLQWYITNDRILTFIVSANGEIKYRESSETDLQSFIDTINIYQQEKEQLRDLLKKFSSILHINDILALIPEACKRLIIIPHLDLHILPIHAFPIDDRQILQDRYNVQYAPSCQLLQVAQTRHHRHFSKLFAIQNPTHPKNLAFAELEVNVISHFFNQNTILAKDKATKNALKSSPNLSDSHCYHFACHGGFNQNNPLESTLSLANQEPLTLGDIFELRLNQCRLVTLSACETGLIDLKSISDEYIGLPSGFLFAGSSTVVSSLWQVDDLSTSFLMIKFYENLKQRPYLQQGDVAIALKQAQNWLRTL